MKVRETCLFYRTGQNIDGTVLFMDALRPFRMQHFETPQLFCTPRPIKILLLAEPLVRPSFSKRILSQRSLIVNTWSLPISQQSFICHHLLDDVHATKPISSKNLVEGKNHKIIPHLFRITNNKGLFI